MKVDKTDGRDPGRICFIEYKLTTYWSSKVDFKERLVFWLGDTRNTETGKSWRISSMRAL